jgi:hypothetical protein
MPVYAKEGIGYYELKKHKSWFDEGHLMLVHFRKQAKLQLQHPSQLNWNKLIIEESHNILNKRKNYFCYCICIGSVMLDIEKYVLLYH